MSGSSTTDAIREHYLSRRLPPMVILDITNVCNLKCVHCPQPMMQAKPDFKGRFLAPQSFAKIIDEIGAVGETTLLRFVGDGEPLLHKEILPMLAAAGRHDNIVTNLTTNGLLLTDEVIDHLIEHRVGVIDISIDALTRPVYDKVRKGGNYPRLMRNIFSLIDKVKKAKASTKLMVSFIRQEENEDEAEGFRAFWEPLVDFVMIRSLHSAMGLVKVEESASRSGKETTERYPCPHLWKRLTVDFNGAIHYCAVQWEGGAEVGHIETTTLEEAWHGAAMTALRQADLARTYPDGSLCGPCADWATTRWDFGYERLIDRVALGKPTLFPFD